jgi:hypothetical protein
LIKNFTRRNRLDQPEYDLQYEYIPQAFRLDIYKAIREKCEDAVREYNYYRDSAVSIHRDSIRLADIEDIEENYNPDFLIEMFLKCEWHEFLSLVEHFVNEGPLGEQEVNELFEYHKIGYRIESEGILSDNGKVILHYDTFIEDTKRVLDSDIKYKGVIASIKAAQKNLLDPEYISLAQSMKHSVDAVEGYLKGWLNAKKIKATTLGDAIRELEKKDLCPKHITKSLGEYYNYRNRTANVGHGSPEVADISKEDAILFLEMSTSFINYFHRCKNK